MPFAQRSRIASLGGKKAHAPGTAHRFTHDEAVRAGQKGGGTPRTSAGAFDRRQGRPDRHDAVGHIESGTPVRDDDAGDREASNSIVDRPLVLLVEMAGGLVEQ